MIFPESWRVRFRDGRHFGSSLAELAALFSAQYGPADLHLQLRWLTAKISVTNSGLFVSNRRSVFDTSVVIGYAEITAAAVLAATGASAVLSRRRAAIWCAAALRNAAWTGTALRIHVIRLRNCAVTESAATMRHRSAAPGCAAPRSVA
jgi:hypothetical protein